MNKLNCYEINSYDQFITIIKEKKDKRKILIIYIKNYLIKGLGISWLRTLIKLINTKYKSYNIKFYIDSGNDHGLSILIMKENIHYLKIKSNKIIFEKIKQIAKKNKVLLNPNFNIVSTQKIKKRFDL